MTPRSRANASSGSAAAVSRSSARSGWRESAESSIVTFASSARTDALGRDDQRVDLAERRVRLDEAAVELLDDRARSGRARPRRRPGASELARVVRLEPSSGSTWTRTSASGVSAATCSISTPPSVVNISSGLPRAAVERDREVVLAARSRRRCSIQSLRTTCPRMSSPRISARPRSASSGSAASFTPPAFPRPPVSTCAFTTTCAAELLGRRPCLLRASSRRVPRRPGCRTARTAPCPGARSRSTGSTLPTGDAARQAYPHVRCRSPTSSRSRGSQPRRSSSCSSR